VPLQRRIILYCGRSPAAPPDLLARWATSRDLEFEPYDAPAEVETLILRGRGAAVFLEDSSDQPDREALVRRLKADPSTAIIPVTILTRSHDPAAVEAWYAAGADEVLSPLFEPGEQRARLDALMARTERDVGVHPSTRLPGTNEIEREIRRRLDASAQFAVCYADLDHFKEFNDRYSYYDGDRVIYIVSRILHDVVRGLLGSDGFVGHIGGDDFIFVTALGDYPPVCTEVLDVFDELIPLQYSDQDRRAGYFFGKDRRGQLHRVPLMTLSIGVVTNQHRAFTHPAEVSELATEMKSYAKTLPGSVFVADRRRGEQELRSGPGGRDARSP
jgi:GGDEF domain-containing protein